MSGNASKHLGDPSKLDAAQLESGDIASDGAVFSVHRWGDQAGRLFRQNGQFYRAIRSSHSSLYKQLLRTGVIERLSDRSIFVRTTTTEMKLDGYEMVLWHETMPFVSYPNEWCAPMMRDAVLATLDVQIELLGHDATLDDAHPWNIIFDGTQPVLVDFSAITHDPNNGIWPAENDFRRYMLYPLWLMKRGRVALGRMLTETGAINDVDLVPLLRFTISWRVQEFTRRILQRLMPAVGCGTTAGLIKRLRKIRAQTVRLTLSPDIPEPSKADLQSDSSLASAVVDCAQQLGVSSVMTVGCSDRMWPCILAHKDVTVVACDPRDEACSALFERAKQEGLNILPLCVDVVEALSVFGTFDKAVGPLAQRLACDLVVAPEMGSLPSSNEGWKMLDQRIEALGAIGRRGVMLRLQDADQEDSDALLSQFMGRRGCRIRVLEIPNQVGRWYICENQ